MKKQLIACFLSFAMMLSVFVIPAFAQQSDLAPQAASAILMEYTSGKIIYEKEKDKKLYPASMTKMMGLYLIFQKINEGKLTWEDMVMTSEHAASMGGSQVFLEVNETMSVKDMVKSICIASANDAMVAMAEKVSGTHEGFVQQMNETAKQLGMKNTNFVNATGLHDDNHYTTAYDMAILAQALIQEGGEELLTITSTYDAYIRENSEQKFWLVNTNKLLKQYSGVDGLKTGFTQEAMYCISATAQKNGLRFIAVVMKEPDTKVRNAEIKTMLDYGFSQYEQTQLYKKGDIVTTETLEYVKPSNVTLISKEDVYYVYEKGKKPQESKREILWNEELTTYQPEDTAATLRITLEDGMTIDAPLTVQEVVQPLGFQDILWQTWRDLFA